MKYLFYAPLFLLLSCATKPKFDSDFCYVYKTNLVCSEKQENGTYKTVDRSFEEVKDFEGFVLIPVEDFEKAFAQE